MGYIGQTPSAVPLDGSDIADDIVDSQHYAAGSIDTAHLADDQITLAKMAAGTDGNIISYDASGNPVAIATGSDGQVLTSAGAGAPPAFEAAAAGGVVVQVVNVSTSALISHTTTMPADASIPQISEGGAYMELAITPTNASNKLFIQVIAGVHWNGYAGIRSDSLALFQDSTANALASSQQSVGNSWTTTFAFNHFMTSGTTSATTFYVRGGTHQAGTSNLNGAAGGIMHGSAASSITIAEIAV